MCTKVFVSFWVESLVQLREEGKEKFSKKKVI